MPGRAPTLEEVTRLVVDAWLAAYGAERPVFVGDARSPVRTLEVRHEFRKRFPEFADYVRETDDPLVMNRAGQPWVPGQPVAAIRNRADWHG